MFLVLVSATYKETDGEPTEGLEDSLKHNKEL